MWAGLCSSSTNQRPLFATLCRNSPRAPGLSAGYQDNTSCFRLRALTFKLKAFIYWTSEAAFSNTEAKIMNMTKLWKRQNVYSETKYLCFIFNLFFSFVFFHSFSIFFFHTVHIDLLNNWKVRYEIIKNI